MNLEQTIIDATTEIFSTMVGMDIASAPPLESPVLTFRDSVTGIVGLAGSCKGMLAIHTPEEVAKALTGSFLGLEVLEIDEDVKDAVGELANMVAGGIKSALTSGGKDIKMSIPSTICGEEYTLDSPDEAEGVMVPFACSAGEFLVEMQLQMEA